MAQFLAQPLEWFERCHRRYGDLFTIQFRGKPMVMACAPELVKAIYHADPKTLAAGVAKVSVFGPIVGESSILVLDGDAHLRRRRQLIPAFRGERMGAYTELMREATIELLPKWPRERAFRLHPRVTEIAMLATLRGIFGADMDPRLPEVLSALVADAVGSKLLFVPALQRDWGPNSPWGRVQAVLRAADEVLFDEIARRREAADADAIDTLGLLLRSRDEAGEGLSDQQLRDELVTLVAAGYEISGLSLAWILTDIIVQPGVQAALREEVERVAGHAPIEREHAAELELIAAAIMESLRLHSPVVQGSVRQVQAPFAIAGYELPVGAMVSVNMYLLHRQIEHYERPRSFVLERFVDRKPPAYAWVPFGGGTRRCLGMQLALHEFKVVIATILQHFELALAQPEVHAERKGAFMGPSGGPQVRARAIREGFDR